MLCTLRVYVHPSIVTNQSQITSTFSPAACRHNTSQISIHQGPPHCRTHHTHLQTCHMAHTAAAHGGLYLAHHARRARGCTLSCSAASGPLTPARAEEQPLEPPVSCPPTCAAVRRLRASIATDGAFEPRAPSPPGEQDEVACCAARDGRLSALGAIVHAARVCLPSRETRHSRLWKRPLVPERSLGGAPQRCLTCLSLSSLNATCAQERAAGRRPSSYS